MRRSQVLLEWQEILMSEAAIAKRDAFDYLQWMTATEIVIPTKCKT